MKWVAKILVILLAVMGSQGSRGQQLLPNSPAFASNSPTPLIPRPKTPEQPAGFTNSLNNSDDSYGWGTNAYWWTNVATITNAPHRGATNTLPSHVVTTGNIPKAPADLETLVQQFKKQQRSLQRDLNNANDTQRQQILQQLEQVRQQLIQQVENARSDLSDQARGMSSVFNNSFAPLNGASSGNSKPGTTPIGNGNGNGGHGGPHKN
jgi:hypothetical protein